MTPQDIPTGAETADQVQELMRLVESWAQAEENVRGPKSEAAAIAARAALETAIRAALAHPTAQPAAVPLVAFAVGDIVQSLDPEGAPLHCGSSWYPDAVVMHPDPLVLVSRSGDMRWDKWTAERLRKVGAATPGEFAAGLRRLSAEERASIRPAATQPAAPTPAPADMAPRDLGDSASPIGPLGLRPEPQASRPDGSVPIATGEGLYSFVHDLLWSEHLECCGQPVVGAEYMGCQEMVCCGCPEPSLLSNAQIVATLRSRIPEGRARDERPQGRDEDSGPQDRQPGGEATRPETTRVAAQEGVPAETLKRFALSPDNGLMYESARGPWVRFQDVATHPTPAQEAPQVETPAASVDELLRQTHELAEATRNRPGVAVKMPPLLREEGAKFMRGEPSLFGQVPLGMASRVASTIEVAALATPPAPQEAPDARKPDFWGFVNAADCRVEMCFSPSAPNADGRYAVPIWVGQRPAPQEAPQGSAGVPAEAPAAPDVNERDAFEADYIQRFQAPGQLGREPDGSYGHLLTQARWGGWRARAASASSNQEQNHE